MREWYPKIAADLPVPGHPPPDHFTIRFDPTVGLIKTVGTPIAVNRAWLRQYVTSGEVPGVWGPRRFTEAADKRPRVKPEPVARLQGGHNSVRRVLDGAAKVIRL